MTPEVKKFIEDNICLIENNEFQKMYNIALCKLSCDQIVELDEILLNTDIYKDRYIPFYFSSHRIRQIKCYNVGFGDCFLCKNIADDNAKMLVDCGKHKSKPSSDVIKDICKEFQNVKRTYLILSHLHSDHYSGLEEIFKVQPSLKFNEVYLPNYIANGSLELYAEMIFQAPDSNLGKMARAVLQIPSIFYENLNNGSKIHFLSEGGKVFNYLCAFEALLPRKNNSRRIFNDPALIKEFCEAYKQIIGYEENESGDVVVTINSEQNVSERLKALLAEIPQKELPAIDKKEVDELKKRFKNHHNELSLAFHELYVENEKNVLFLGDAEKKNVQYLAKGKLKGNYCFVKVQHHGTKNYFCNQLPPSKYCVISNGKEKDSWEISGLYDAHYAGKTKLVCINNSNCELLKNGVCCDSKTYHSAMCGSSHFFEEIDII